MHIDYKNGEVKKWLRSESNLNPLSCELLTEEDSRPRDILSEGGLFLILRVVNCNPGADPEDMVALRMNFNEQRIITMRHRRVMAINDVHNNDITMIGGTQNRAIFELYHFKFR